MSTTIVQRPPDPYKDAIRGAGDDGYNAPIGPQPVASTGGRRATSRLTPDSATTERFAAVLMRDNVVLELRSFRARYANGYIEPADYNTTYAAWCDSPDQFAAEAFRARDVSIFTTFNRINPDLLARSYNRFARQKHTTKDDDVTAIRWLFLDVDPERPADVSATEAERTAALNKRDAIIATTPGLGGAVLTGSSGNGAYILARIDETPNDEAGRKLIADGLRIFGRLHDDPAVKVDQKTKNPARIMAVAGSVKCKGSNIPERPWRLVTLDAVPEIDARFDLAGFVAAHSDLLAQIEAESKRPARTPRATTAGTPLPDVATPQHDLDARIFRATRYLMNMEPAISGQNGHDQLLDATCAAVKGFGLSPAQALPLIEAYNAKCLPPWSYPEIDHKLNEADNLPDDKPRGYLFDRDAAQASPGGEAPTPAAHVGDPHSDGRYFLARYSHHDDPTLKFWQSVHWEWRGGAWAEKPEDELRGEINHSTGERYLDAYNADLAQWAASGGGKDRPKLRPVTSAAVGNILGAIEGNPNVMLAQRDYPAMPCWLGGAGDGLPAEEMIAFPNALVHAPSFASGNRKIMPPTPLFFNAAALDYAFDPDAPEPTRFLAFLAQLWPGDRESPDCLQEWFGLNLVPVTKYQKIMALIGPTRAGKGAILRLMEKMVGKANSVGLTLGKLENGFGLQSSIGKLSAIIDDARISGQSNLALITESLLTLSGEGLMSVGRKHRSDWEGKLTARITMASNELPRLPDNSGALVTRFLVLRFTQSFAGREDLTLDAALEAELPGVLLWALKGLARLTDRGRFIQPASGAELHGEFRELASPISAFLSECCIVGDDEAAEKDELYRAWRGWCDSSGREKPGDRTLFFRNLRAAIPGIANVRAGSDGHRVQKIKGVGLRHDSPDHLAAQPAEAAEWFDHRGDPF